MEQRPHLDALRHPAGVDDAVADPCMLLEPAQQRLSVPRRLRFAPQYYHRCRTALRRRSDPSLCFISGPNAHGWLGRLLRSAYSFMDTGDAALAALHAWYYAVSEVET